MGTDQGKGQEAKSAEARHRSPPDVEEFNDSGLERIREILFGSIQHDLERRVFRTDAHLAARSQDVAQEARRRSEVLEMHFKKELEAIAARVERGLTETGEALRKVTRDQQDAIARVEQRLAKVEEASAQGQRELRRHMLDQAKSFLDELQQLRKELLATLQHELGLAERELVEELREGEEHAGH